MSKNGFLKEFATFHPVSWAVIIGTFLSRSGFFMTIPFLGIYLLEVKGYDPATVGAILGISFLVGTLSSFVGGTFSDKLGRYPIMIASIFLWSLVFLGFTIADSVLSFFLLNALNGFCRNVFEPTARALLADVTASHNRAAVFNARYFAINMGAAVGPLVGFQLGGTSSIVPFMVAAAIYVLYGFAIIYLKFRYQEARKSASTNEVTISKALKIVASDKVFRYFLVGNIFIFGGFSHLETTLAQYMGGEGVGSYSFLFTVNAISVLVLQYPVIHIAKKHFTSIGSIQIGSILLGAGLFGFGLFDSIVGQVLSMVVFTIGEILCMVIGDVAIGEIAPEHLRGTYYGASGFQFLGQSFGAWIGGVLLSVFGFEHGAIVFGILMVLTLLSYPFFQIGQKIHSSKEKTVTA